MEEQTVGKSATNLGRAFRARKPLVGVVAPVVAITIAFTVSGCAQDDTFLYRGLHTEYNFGEGCSDGDATATAYLPNRDKFGEAPLARIKDESRKITNGNRKGEYQWECQYLFEFPSLPSEPGEYTIIIERQGRFLSKHEGTQEELESNSNHTPMP